MPELRILGAEDSLSHRRLMSHAFGRGAVVVAPAEPVEPPKETLGLFVQGELLSALTTCPFTVYWPGARGGALALGGVAGVATYAEARGEGHVDQLLRESLRRMREAGQVISALYPFAWKFYQRYGWDAVGEKRTLTLPLRELPSGRRAAKRLSDAEAQEQVPALYARGAQRYRGAFTAETRRWPGPLEHSEGRLTYPYATEGGYLLWRYSEVGEVREYVSATPEAEAGLLQLLRDLGMQVGKGRVTLPSDETLSVRFPHNDTETRTAPVFSGRVVDLKAALEALETSALETSVPEGALVLGVEDATAPWNQGRWRVEVAGGGVSCVPTDETPQLALDIRALSQAYWGAPDLARLRRAGRVEVQDEAAFALLAQLLPPHPVMCWNHF